MKKFWMNIIKPASGYARWLVFLTLIALIALGVTGYLDFFKHHLDTEQFTLKIGDYKVSAYGALRALITLALIFWTTAIISNLAEKRINKIRKIRAANRALLVKSIQIGIYILSFIIALDIIGIDLTTLTVFSGALGIGLGFGLQKIASNFVSGMILLLEKTVEQGDLIELPDGIFGFVRKTNARYTLLETFDTKEILIPNEDLITSRVTNWTLSNSHGRVEIPIGVSYGSDIEKARDIILKAAKEHPRSITTPEPKCLLRNFGDSSVDFILHFWVSDVALGRWEPQSEVMFEIWRQFKKNNIEIPFPQRDLHIKNPETLKGKTK